MITKTLVIISELAPRDLSTPVRKVQAYNPIDEWDSITGAVAEKAVQWVKDEVGKNNYVDTLDDGKQPHEYSVGTVVLKYSHLPNIINVYVVSVATSWIYRNYTHTIFLGEFRGFERQRDDTHIHMLLQQLSEQTINIERLTEKLTDAQNTIYELETRLVGTRAHAGDTKRAKTENTGEARKQMNARWGKVVGEIANFNHSKLVKTE